MGGGWLGAEPRPRGSDRMVKELESTVANVAGDLRLTLQRDDNQRVGGDHPQMLYANQIGREQAHVSVLTKKTLVEKRGHLGSFGRPSGGKGDAARVSGSGEHLALAMQQAYASQPSQRVYDPGVITPRTEEKEYLKAESAMRSWLRDQQQ